MAVILMDIVQSQKILTGSTYGCVTKPINITAIPQYLQNSQHRDIEITTDNHTTLYIT